MIRRLTALYNVFTRPLRENACFALFIVVLFTANWWFTRFPAEPLAVVEAYGQLALGVYLFLAFVTLLRSIVTATVVGRTVVAVGMLTMYAVCIVESVLAARYGARISPSMLALVADATADDARTWLEASAADGEVRLVAAVYGAVGLVHIVLRAVWHRIRGTFGAVCGVMVVAAAVSTPRWMERQDHIWTYMLLSNSRLLERCDEANFYSSPLRMAWALKFYAIISREAKAVEQHTAAARVKGCSATGCPKIVCIIGDSYNKHHASLYGYRLLTTPVQEAWWNDSCLVRFSDVVTPWNEAAGAFKDFMTTHSTNAAGSWTDGVLFPALFRRAGYHVAFLSNQLYDDRLLTSDAVNASFFFNRVATDTMCFDERSRVHHPTDGPFVREALGAYRHHDRELVMVHLQGQRMVYRERVPRGNAYKFFSLADYQRPELDTGKLLTLADYDNACRYNDEVVDSIYAQFKDEEAIFVYFAPYGEYVFDGRRERFGRSRESEIRREVARDEFEVPMVVFFTPRFREAHRDVVERLEAVCDVPFSIDDIPHFLLGLAGIRTSHYSQQHDPLHPRYDATRRRKLRGNTDYDKLMKK